ncbi:hypothetical protein L6V77_35185 [Myxococcota bacterium]|nr:hypothetical protein [Myxococcota bacterium]
MVSPWRGDWERRVAERVGALGFESVEFFVQSRRGRPFGELAKELGEDVAHMQIERMYLSECNEDGRLVEAAAECLARTIIERFPRGWGIGVRLDYRTASALAAWISDMLHRVEQSELTEAALDAIADALQKTHPPPKGWLPENGQDPLIQRAFKIGLMKDEG